VKQISRLSGASADPKCSRFAVVRDVVLPARRECTAAVGVSLD